MKKKEYLDSATKKIFNATAQKMVEEELGGHIDERREVYAGFMENEETAEEKAVADMGDAALVCESFGEIHNDFYNPAWDIVSLLLHGGLLGGLYYLAQRYVSGDAGMFCALPAAAALAVSLMLADEALCLKRRKLIPSLFSVLRLGGTGAFLYYIFWEIDGAVSSDYSLLIKRLSMPLLMKASNYHNRESVLYTTIIICVLLWAGIAVSLIGQYKAYRLLTKSRDNRLRRRMLSVTRFLAVLFAAFAVFFSVKTAYDIRVCRRDYENAVKEVLSAAQTCKTREELAALLDSSKLPFMPSYDSNGNQTGWVCHSGAASVSVSYQPEEDETEVSQATNAPDALQSLYEYANSSLNKQPKPDYAISFMCDSTLFEKKTDSLTLSALIQLGERQQEEFSRLDLATASRQEVYDHLISYTPYRFTVSHFSGAQNYTGYNFVYLFGSGDLKFEEIRTDILPDEESVALYQQMDALRADLKANYDKSDADLAAAVGAVKQKVDVTERVRAMQQVYYDMLGLGTAPEGKRIDEDTYRLNDNLYYSIQNMNSMRIAAVYNREDYLLDLVLLSDPEEGVSDTADAWSKLGFNGYYYDRYGRCYTEPERVPYYTNDRKRYLFYAQTIKNDITVGDTKEYYLTDGKAYYPADSCFVDEHGFLFIDKEGQIKQGEDGVYLSPDGARYAKAMYTSWNSNGHLFAVSDTESE